MATYTYRAVDPQGKIIHGSLEAPNERALESRLRQADSELVSCNKRRRRRFGKGSTVGRKDLIGFCFHLEQVTKAGLPMLEALIDLRDSITLPEFKSVIANLIISVEAGQTLSQAMKDFPDTFDHVFVSLIAVGEETGELPKVMQKMTESLKWQDELIAKSKSIVMYPAFVGVVVLSVLVFMMLYVVPEMVGFIEGMGQELPFHTLALIGLSNFLVGNWYWVIPLPFVIIWLIRFQARRSEHMRLTVDGWKLRLWYVGPIINKLILNRFASYFGLLYGAGLNVLAALKLSEEIAGNAVIRKGLQQISLSIADGISLSSSIEATGLFPPLVVRMVKMGETTGELDVALDNVSYFYDREVAESIDKLEAIIEPAMTVVLGAIMGWIMLSVLGPIYDTLGQLGI